MLVPEVSLVTQLADRVACRSSATSWRSCTRASRRGSVTTSWWRILRGEARVVVGTRTAVFAPLSDLGLIVVDEAHDGAYKADRTPRYDARWVARRRAALTGARVVMGTATPDVVTLARARGGLLERARLASGESAARRRSSWSTCATSWRGQSLDLLACAARRSADLQAGRASRRSCS